MILINSDFMVPKGYGGITLYPFVFKRKDKKLTQRFIRHESIHLKQQSEMLVLFFYIWYLIEYVIRRLQHKTWKEAYYNISFEKEAYSNENDINYNRSPYEWVKYLKKK